MRRISFLFIICVMMVTLAVPSLARYIVNGVPSDTPPVETSNSSELPDPGPVVDEEFIDFDDVVAPGLFNDQIALTNEYAAQGVIFAGMGEVLDESGNFSITNYSSPNFLAFSTGAGVPGPEMMYFDPPITSVSIYGGHGSSSTVTMTAFDVTGAPIGTTSIFGGSALQELTLTVNGIVAVELSFAGTVCCFDDLWFDGDPEPVSFDLFPMVTDIPDGGGNVVYDAQLISIIGLMMPGLRYQSFVTLPNQQVMGPIDNIPFTLTPFMNIYVAGMNLNVPDYAPTGPYLFEGMVGNPNNPAQQLWDFFPFTKHPPVGAGLHEDFEDGIAQNFDWFVGDAGSWVVNDGYGKVDVAAEVDDWGGASYNGDTFGDMSASTTYELIVSPGGNSVGLLFCGNGPQDGDYAGYAVYFSLDYYSCWVYTAGTPTNLVGWTQMPGLINQGVGAINTMQIDASGGNFDITANGNYLGSFFDATYASGQTGFTTAYTNEVWYEDLHCVHVPAPNAIGPITIGELDPVLRDHMGNVITDAADYYVPGVAFDRSAEIIAESTIEFIPSDWVGSGFEIASEAGSSVSVPTHFALENAYPNPFNAATTVRVTLPESADLTVSVYNVAGQLVATIADGNYTAGKHSLTFDASNVASGLYFIRATVPGQMNTTQKVMLVR
jgi:Secretion system C-terminal sorting domain